MFARQQLCLVLHWCLSFLAIIHQSVVAQRRIVASLISRLWLVRPNANALVAVDVNNCRSRLMSHSVSDALMNDDGGRWPGADETEMNS